MNEENIDVAMLHLVAVDSDIAQAFGLLNSPAPRHRPAGFETFIRTVVGQQISTKVAEIIMIRLMELLPECTAEGVLAVSDESLRAVGLSYRKISYIKGLAEAVHSGQLDIEGLERLDNDEAIQIITGIRGFGRWSAEIYLMFSLQRQDVFPADDLAIRVALGQLKGLNDKPTPKQARLMTEHWAPWRSVGALFLWHYYRGAPA